ncbi:extracellular multicopper oxidase [Sistotremastrum niveocremeum HHB9708]|uniref:Extracellular multicopper oxidase n=1 Tax=Sistotremastrum niveocremeum HHB9708 TaxID=1314777 RepID=A0A164YJL5_9AGAM|nr:extracellular multicopper oxidase [Sistotremastrum niveocremeum HHB9708]
MSSPSLNDKQYFAQRPTTKSRKPLLVVAGLVVVGVLALALGLGLGLGLKHHHNASAASSSPSPSAAPLQTSPTENFVLSGSIVGQPPQTRTYNFTISQVSGAPDGVQRSMLVVNGLYPGPTIEANQGDRLVVNVFNQIENATAIHWHGLFQNGTNFFDGTAGITECGIPPGQSLTYNFTFGEFYGTTWYHHSFPQAYLLRILTPRSDSTQYSDGITGALIVYPTASNPPSIPKYDQDLVVELSDWYHDFSTDLLAQYLSPDGIQGTPGNEPVPDGGTLNGLGQYGAAGSGGTYFNFTLEANKTYRLRLINTGSFTSIRFSIDNHTLTIVEADSLLVEPINVSGVTLAVAQRYSVLFTTNQTAGNYWMRAELATDMFTYTQPGQNTDIRGILKYTPLDALPTASDDPGANGLGDLDTSLLVPAIAVNAPESTVHYSATVSFQNTDQGKFLAFLNSTSWEPLAGTSTLLAVKNSSSFAEEGAGISSVGDQLIVTEDRISVIDFEVDNLDDGDHPFHLHGHRPWIVGAGAGRYTGQPLNSTNPMSRDVILIPAYTYVVLRFVTDNPGVWAFHCHLSWHMAAGLLMQFNSLPSVSSQFDIPQAILSQCGAS